MKNFNGIKLILVGINISIVGLIFIVNPEYNYSTLGTNLGIAGVIFSVVGLFKSESK